MIQQNRSLPQPYILIGVSNETPPELPLDRPPEQALEAQTGCLWLRIPIPESRIEEAVPRLPASLIIDGPDETEPNSPEPCVAGQVAPHICVIEPTDVRQGTHRKLKKQKK